MIWIQQTLSYKIKKKKFKNLSIFSSSLLNDNELPNVDEKKSAKNFYVICVNFQKGGSYTFRKYK